VTTVAFPFGAHEPEPNVAEPELPRVQVEGLPSRDRTVPRCHPCHVHWVDHEAGMASRKARVLEVIVFSSPPPVPAGNSVSLVAAVAGEGGSEGHAHDMGCITIGRGQRRKEPGWRQ